MKKKQPLHCAHVAEYYVEQAEILVSCIRSHVFGRTTSSGSQIPPNHDWGLRSVRLAPANVYQAIREFNRAGGEGKSC